MIATEDAMVLQTKVKELREKMDLSQEDLARQAGLGLGVIQKIEQGKTKDPSSSRLLRIAKALGVSMEKLLDDPEERPEKRR